MKNILFLGSSVTNGSGNNNVSFVEIIREKTNYNCVKNAVNGTTLADLGENSYIKRFKRAILEFAPDILVVQLSTNDATQKVDYGLISKSKEYNISTTFGAIEQIIDIAKNNLNCKVIFYTNPHYESKEYVLLVNGLKVIKEKWDIAVVDFYNMPLKETFMTDAIHPNNEGYLWMSDVLLKYL